MQIIHTAREIAEIAASVWDQCARASLVGFTRASNRAHIARAALEDIAFQVSDILEAMESDSGVPLKELRVNSGAARNNLLMQLPAELPGCRVTRPLNPESTVLGATYLAGLAVGYWPDQETIARITPEDRKAKRASWTRTLDRSRAWETH